MVAETTTNIKRLLLLQFRHGISFFTQTCTVCGCLIGHASGRGVESESDGKASTVRPTVVLLVVLSQGTYYFSAASNPFQYHLHSYHYADQPLFLHDYNAEAYLHERQVEDVDTMGDEPHVETCQVAGEAELEALRDLDVAPAPLPVYDKPSQNTSSQTSQYAPV